jgi:hypothetical protein
MSDTPLHCDSEDIFHRAQANTEYGRNVLRSKL